MGIGSEFDAWTDGYTDLMLRIVPYYRELMAGLFAMLPRSFSCNKVVDLGCGTGNVISAAALRYPEAQITGVDASQEMLLRIESRFPDTRIRGKMGMMQDVNFAEASVDLVTASFSLHHLTSDQKKVVIENAFTWLRRGGYFLSSDLMVNESSPEHIETLQVWQDFVLQNSSQEEWDWLIDHHHRYDRVQGEQEIVEIFLESGYNSIQTNRHEKVWVALAAQR